MNYNDEDGKRKRDPNNSLEAPEPKRLRVGDHSLNPIEIDDDEKPVPMPGLLRPPKPIRPMRGRKKADICKKPKPKTVTWGERLFPTPDPSVPGDTTANPINITASKPPLQPSTNPIIFDANTPSIGIVTPVTAPVPKKTARHPPLVAWKAGDTYLDVPDNYPSPGRRRESIKVLTPIWGDDPCKGLSFRSTIQQRDWLRTEPKWTNQLGNGFRGAKILGIGGFGLVGLWKRDDKSMKPNKVVVKQQLKNLKSMQEEARYLKLMSGTGSNHMVKMYKEMFKEVGLGTAEVFDNVGIPVGRIFLEFCEGGDFQKFVMGTYR